MKLLKKIIHPNPKLMSSRELRADTGAKNWPSNSIIGLIQSATSVGILMNIFKELSASKIKMKIIPSILLRSPFDYYL
jgi:hypothetical protein